MGNQVRCISITAFRQVHLVAQPSCIPLAAISTLLDHRVYECAGWMVADPRCDATALVRHLGQRRTAVARPDAGYARHRVDVTTPDSQEQRAHSIADVRQSQIGPVPECSALSRCLRQTIFVQPTLIAFDPRWLQPAV